MSVSAVGVIFSNTHEENVPELVHKRTMASIPFAGRYRLIDFPLSNMVNAGIMTVGLMANNNYRSLIDHIGSGKDWDLARKDGGVILLPPYSDENEKLFTTRLEALIGLKGFLKRRKEKDVVLSDCDSVMRLNIEDILNFHENRNADITMISHYGDIVKHHKNTIIESDQSGRVNKLIINSPLHKDMKANNYINVMIVNREFLLNLVEEAVMRGVSDIKTDIIAKQLDVMKVYNYEFKGYFAGIKSLKTYFKYSMDMLKKEVREELFGQRDIFTKVRDSAPSKYGKNAIVKNSLISDGCDIEGVVKNSILFRGVKVEKGAVVENSIVMQDTIIGINANLNCVITDKNVIITNNRKLSGCEELPYYISKGKSL